jgi:hypothetical protein
MFRSSLRTSPVARPPSFGRRGVQEDRFAVAADDIWRGVAALHKLSAEAQLDREVRSACLYYALRHFHPADAIDAIVAHVDARIQAFQRLIAEAPDMLEHETIDATLEDAIYATIARTPLVVIDGEVRFDPRAFAARLPSALEREINARARTGRLRSAEREQLFLDTLH